MRDVTTGRGGDEDDRVVARTGGGGLGDSARRVVRTTGITGAHEDGGLGGLAKLPTPR
jgi:hypothetical protein